MAQRGRPKKQPEDISQSVNIQQEYVSGGLASIYIKEFYESLPHYIDDVTADFGADLYERMMHDGQVAAAVNLIKRAILAQGIRLGNRYDQEDKKYNRAEEIRLFVQRRLDNMSTPLEEVADELLDGLPFGYKISEKIYKKVKEGPDKGKIGYRAIKAKPRDTTAFVVNRYKDVVSILGITPNEGISTPPAGPILGRSQPLTGKLLPRSKFVVYAPFKKDSDPRGQSILRPAYNAWWIKTMVWPEYLKYLSQFASPSIIGTTAENAQPQVTSDSNGNPVLDAAGQPVKISPEQVMAQALAGFKNGTAAAFPFGSTVTPIIVEGDGTAFLNAIRVLNEEITKAILFQTLATGEGQFMARAAASTHQDVLDLVIRTGKLTLAHTLEEDVVKDLVFLNYGPEAVEEYMPIVQLPEVAIQDFANNANAVATLHSVGFFDDSQLPALDAKLDIPVRDMESWRRKQEEAMQLQIDLKTKGIAGGANAGPKKPPGKNDKPGGKVPDNTDPKSLAKGGDK